MNEEEAFQRLCAGQIEGTLTDEERSRLAELLKASDEARHAYATQMRMHAMLNWQHHPIQFALPEGGGEAAGKIIRPGVWRWLALAAAAVVLFFCGLFASRFFIREKPAPLASAVPGSFGGLPVAVLDTIQRQTDGQTVVSIKRNEGIGQVCYTISTKTQNDGEAVFTVAEDGTLLSRDTTLVSVPPAVQKAVKARLGPGRLESIEENFGDIQTTYVATIAAPNGTERDFTFNGNGTLASIEMPFSEVPAPVSTAVKARASEIGWIEKAFENGAVTYAVAMVTRDGRQRHFTFREDGSLAVMEITPSEIPGAVKTAIGAQVGQGHLGEIDETFDKGEIAYQVSITGPDGHWREVSFTEQGKPHRHPHPHHRRWHRPPPRPRPNNLLQQTTPPPTNETTTTPNS